MSRSRYQFIETDRPHFLTCTVVDWTSVFTRPSMAEIVLNSWEYLIKQERIRLHGYVIMENHVHWIASSEDIAKQVATFKSFTGKQGLQVMREEGEERMLRRLRRERSERDGGWKHQLWQEDSHPEAIISEAMMIQKLEYIHNNPVERGYVDDPVHWRYSSARDYKGLVGLLPVDRDW